MRRRSAFAAPSPTALMRPLGDALRSTLRACRTFRRPVRARLARVTTQYLPTALPRLRSPSSRVSALHIYLSARGVHGAHVRSTLRALRVLADASIRAPTSNCASGVLRLLASAGFTPLSEAPELSPPHSVSVPVRVRRVACFRTLEAANGVEPPGNEFAPAHIAARGLAFERRVGLLARAKFRAIERAYLAPLNAPSTLLRRLFPTRGPAMPEAPRLLARPVAGACARRVVPAGDPRDLLRAAVAQEPAFALVSVLHIASRPRRRAFSAGRLRDALARALRRALDPVGVPSGEPAAPAAVRIALYRDVPWGLLMHVLPAEMQTVLPRVPDLLRVDLLTLLGLCSALATYARDRTSPFIGIALAGTLAVYALRIGFGLQGALSGYRAQIARDKLQRIVATDDAAIKVLMDLAAEKRLVLLACAWAETMLNGKAAAPEIRKAVFEENDPVPAEEWARARAEVKQFAVAGVASDGGG